MFFKINKFKFEEIGKEKILESFQDGMFMQNTNSYKLRRKIIKMVYEENKSC